MRWLELKIPPVPLAGLLAALMWLAARECPAAGFSFPARKSVAICLILIGAITSGAGVVSFRRARTTVNPMNPRASTALVVSGVYRFTRNPMYLGFLLMLFGWAAILSNMVSFLFAPGFYFYMNRFQIEPEERVLASVFGEAFAAYRSRARRWL